MRSARASLAAAIHASGVCAAVLARPRRQGQWQTRQRTVSADRRRVHQAALGPQVVDAARQVDRRLLAQVALETLAIVAHLLDDAIRPLRIQAEQLAHVLGNAEEAL